MVVGEHDMMITFSQFTYDDNMSHFGILSCQTIHKFVLVSYVYIMYNIYEPQLGMVIIILNCASQIPKWDNT